MDIGEHRQLGWQVVREFEIDELARNKKKVKKIGLIRKEVETCL